MSARRRAGEAPEYFPSEAGGPRPLQIVCSRRVRFEELDPLGIMWHGRYVSYCEDGRVAFGREYGLSYSELMRRETAAPIVRFHLDYFAPLGFDQLVRIETTLHWSAAMRLNFSYAIRKEDGTLAASGYSVQLLTDLAGNVLFIAPDWVKRFQDNWRAGLLHDRAVPHTGTEPG